MPDFSRYEREIEEAVERLARGSARGYFMKHAIEVLAELDDFVEARRAPRRVEESVRRAAWTCVSACTEKPEESFAECWYWLARRGLSEEEAGLVDEFWRYHLENVSKYSRALKDYMLAREGWRERLEPVAFLL